MQKIGKILRPVLQKNPSLTNQPTTQPQLPSLTSTDVENCNMAKGPYAQRQNFKNLEQNEKPFWNLINIASKENPALKFGKIKKTK